MIWNEAQIEQLKLFYQQGKDCEYIAQQLGTTCRAVKTKAWRLGITNNNSYTEEEKRYILENYKSYNLREIAETLGRPKANICRFARENGIERTCKKKEHRKPTRKFETKEERLAWKSRQMKEWHSTHAHPKGMLGKHHTEEYCEELRKRAVEFWANASPQQLEDRKQKQRKTKIENDTLNPNKNHGNAYSRTKSGKRKDLCDVFFRSSWEANFARILNFENIEWQYEPKTFYFEGGKILSYTPDFYLPQFNVWIEVKGWFDEKSRMKLQEFKDKQPHEKIFIVCEEEYRKLAKTYKEKIPCWE